MQQHIEWLTPMNPAADRNWLVTLRGRTGGRSRCRLGRVSFQAGDLDRPPRLLPAVRVIAQFEQDVSEEDRMIIGLHASVLQSRRLIVSPDLQEGWLEDW
jgi:hypothetical protein